MKANFKIDGSTTQVQHLALAQFFIALAAGAGAAQQVGGLDELVGEDEPEFTPSLGAEPVAPVVSDTEVEAPKRRRRTKAELEAEAHAAMLKALRAEVAAAEKAEAGNVQAAVTQTAPVTDTTEAQAASSTRAAASPSETAPDSYETAAPAGASKAYSEAEIQDLAGRVARAVGPEVVKAEITALGAARIADLSPEQRNTLGAVLTTKLP